MSAERARMSNQRLGEHLEREIFALQPRRDQPSLWQILRGKTPKRVATGWCSLVSAAEGHTGEWIQVTDNMRRNDSCHAVITSPGSPLEIRSGRRHNEPIATEANQSYREALESALRDDPESTWASIGWGFLLPLRQSIRNASERQGALRDELNAAEAEGLRHKALAFVALTCTEGEPERALAWSLRGEPNLTPTALIERVRASRTPR